MRGYQLLSPHRASKLETGIFDVPCPSKPDLDRVGRQAQKPKPPKSKKVPPDPQPMKTTLLLLALLFTSSCNHIPFDAQRWKSWQESEADMERGLRWRMVDDLLDQHQLVGKSMADIELLLGPGRVLRGRGESENYTVVYYLGACGNFMDGSLRLTFRQGKVVEVKKSCI